MPKTVKIQAIQPDPPNGPVFGQVSNPADAMKSQVFAHGHTEINARDFIVGKCATRAVCGFDYSLLGGLQFRVLAPGQVLDVNGKSYEIIGSAPIDITLEEPDDTSGRIDLVVAVLESDVDAADELRPFVRLRTQAELDDNDAPYPPQQFAQPTEQHTRARVIVKTGTPALHPVAPTPDGDEEPLYAIAVASLAQQIVANNVTDLRNLVASNCELQDRIDALRKQVLSLPPPKHRHPADEVDLAPGSPGYTVLGATAQDALDKLALAKAPAPGSSGGGAALRPEILRPDLVPYHAQSGKLTSAGAVISGVPAIKIPVPRSVQFQTGVFPVNDNAFVDQTLHPRVINLDPDGGTNSANHEEVLSVSNVIVTETDGGGDWTNLNAAAPSAASSFFTGRRAIARDDRYVELFGGSETGDTSWFEFDAVTKSYEAKSFTGAVPVYPIIFAAPLGNAKALLMTLDNGQDVYDPGGRHWYVVNLATRASVEILTGPGAASDPLSLSAVEAVGDLIETDVVVLFVKHLTSPQTAAFKYYFFHADTNQFENFVPSGEGPTSSFLLDGVHCCFYRQGQALFFQDERASFGRSPRTCILNYATRAFTVLNIAPPQTLSNQFTLNGSAMANINGKPLIVAADWNSTVTGFVSYVYQFTGGGTAPRWSKIETGLPARMLAQLASLLKSGFPQGAGYFFGGREPQTFPWHNDAWGFQAGGIVNSICAGTPGITLGAGTTAATIRLPDFQLPSSFPVGHVRITIRGSNIEGRVRVLESFDDGAHLEEIALDQNTAIVNTNNNPKRQLFLILTGSTNIKPCVSSTYEIFENTAGGGLGMLYLVFDCPVGTNYLFMDDKGKLTVEGAAVATTKSKAILLETIKNGSAAPSTFDYINKPRIERKYEGGPQSGGVAPTVRFDFAVLPDFIQCLKVVAGNAQLLTDCAVAFNGQITVNGLANGESYRVHLAG